MLNEGAAVDDKLLDVIAGPSFPGGINTDHEELLANIRYAIRQGHPQVREDPIKADQILMVGGGPSLESTKEELRDLLWEGKSQLVTLNGAYHWAIKNNLRPNAQVVVDAQPHNVRFVQPYVPNCRYLIASQCHPSVWDAVRDYPNVWIFHAAAGKDDIIRPTLDEYYSGQWHGASGGTTVFTRALSVFRTLGYLRYHLFGMDSCFGADGSHHAYPQAENDVDKRFKVEFEPTGHPDLARTFYCSPWHCQQVKDFIQMLRINGDQYKIASHGDGLISYILQSGADAALREIEAAVEANNEGGKG